jgi:hypothetical protein
MASPTKMEDGKLASEGISNDMPASHKVITAETLSKDEYAPAFYDQPWWRRPISQIVLVSFVCFMCPGKYLIILSTT